MNRRSLLKALAVSAAAPASVLAATPPRVELAPLVQDHVTATEIRRAQQQWCEALALQLAKKLVVFGTVAIAVSEDGTIMEAHFSDLSRVEFGQ